MNNLKKSLLKRIIELGYKHRIAIFSFLIFIIAANLFPIYFVRQEHTIYYMDQVTYWKKLIDIIHNLTENPLNAVKNVIQSIREEDYNDFPSLLLVPFCLLFGESRLSYVLSIVNTFVLITVLSFAWLNKLFCKLYGITSNNIPYVIAILSLFLFPNFWQPILSGYPDVGGLFIINIILFTYLSKPLLEQSKSNLLLIAVMLAILIIFRRWYTYWGVSFYIVLLIQASIISFSTHNTHKNILIRKLLEIFILIFITGILLFIISPTFTIRIIRTNYADIYSGYRMSTSLFETFLQVIKRFGLFYLFSVLFGVVYAAKNKKTRGFSFFLLAQSLIIFFLFARTQDFHQHHLYLLMPAMMLFSSFFIIGLLQENIHFKIPIVCIIFLLSILNFIVPFSITTPCHTNKISFLFAGFRQAPSVRNDINEIDRIIQILESLTKDSDDRVYILAVSDILNCQTIDRAYLSLGRHKDISKRIYWTNAVDKRDGFPRNLLKVKYVVVASPIQYDMSPEDQRVIGIPAELILSQKGIGTSFHKLPYQFTLDRNVKAYIYVRTQPLKDSDINVLSDMLRKYYPDKKNIYNVNPN
jgi:hypothetical protein